MVTCPRVLVILSVVLRYEEVLASDAEERLMAQLFKGYDETVRPVKYDNQAVNVTFNLALFQLKAINEKEQVIEISAWIRQKWNDYRLAWNETEFNGIKEVNVRSDKLWVPDIVHYNNVDPDNAEYGGNMDTLKTRVIVYNTGGLYWLAPIMITASCKIHVEDFPFDTQRCSLTFGSWTYDMARLDVVTDGVDTAKFVTNLEWNLEKAEAVRNEVKYACCDNKYPDVTFHFYFRRRSLFYVLNLIFPIALITLLTICAFILPADSGERVSLAVTLMLAVTVFMLLVAESTPASSESIPLVTVYFIFCMVVMFIIIVLLCYISRFYNRGREDKPMDQWMRRIILGKISYLIGIRARPSRAKDTTRKVENSLVVENSQMNGILMKMKKRFVHVDEAVGDNKYIYGVNGEGGLAALKRPSVSSSVEREGQKHLDPDVQDFKESDKHTSTDRESNEMTYDEEWRIAAMTLDRCLFFGSILIFLVGTIICFAHTTFVR